MHKTLLTLLLALPFAACSNHTGGVVVSDSPLPPVNRPDQRSLDPNTPTTSSSTSGETGSQQSTGGEGGNTGSPSGGNSTANSGNGGNGGGTGTTGGGSQMGEPVPEPSTLLLVGTGLAGLAGASLRRRRRKQA